MGQFKKPTDAKSNWEYNWKKPIPRGWKIRYIDGDSKNWKFANLELVKDDTEMEKVKADNKKKSDAEKAAKEKEAQRVADLMKKKEEDWLKEHQPKKEEPKKEEPKKVVKKKK